MGLCQRCTVLLGTLLLLHAQIWNSHGCVYATTHCSSSGIYIRGNSLLLPANEVAEGNNFCHSVQGWAGGYAWSQVPFGEVGMPGTPPKGTPPWKVQPQVLISSGGHRSGRYAFYWNAFLFLFFVFDRQENNRGTWLHFHGVLFCIFLKVAIQYGHFTMRTLKRQCG